MAVLCLLAQVGGSGMQGMGQDVFLYTIGIISDFSSKAKPMLTPKALAFVSLAFQKGP